MQLAEQEKAIARVLRAKEAMRQGKMIILVDEEDRENEGDLVFAAEHATADLVNFMAKEGRGLICLAMEPTMVDQLQLPMMEDRSKDGCERGTAFTVSIEAKHGVTTGISAADRSATVLAAVHPEAKPSDIVVPGHIFPLRGNAGGVLARSGHTEGSIDLAKLAGCRGAAVICEIMNEDGSMARLPDLQNLAERFDIPLVTIPDLIGYRLMQESMVEVVEKHDVRTSHGVFQAYLFRSRLDGSEHLALVKGENFADEIVDVRVHPQRSFVDVFADVELGGRIRIDHGLRMLSESNHAILVYLTGGDRDLAAEMKEMAVAVDKQVDPAPAKSMMDQRLVGLGSQILRELGVHKMRVHATSKFPYKGLSGFGLEVTDWELIKH